jgi:predicted phage terminase large subunit-like protein
LLNNPEMNIILGSYSQRLANRFSRKVRITFEDGLTAKRGLRTAEASPQRQVSVPSAVADGAVEHSGSAQDKDPSQTPNTELRTPRSVFRSRLNTVSEWETGLGGGVRAVGVGGGITGFGADLVIIDDPIKSRAEAESKTYRERVWDWFNDDLYTRLEPNASIILIQTRWHEDDLAGRLLRESQDEGGEHWDVISLPALAEEAETRVSASVFYHPPQESELKQDGQDRQDSEDKKSSVPVTELSAQTPYPAYPVHPVKVPLAKDDTSDPLGREPGEALCPERFSKADLERIKRKLGSYSFSALYQQRPTPPEGGLFKREWFTRIVNRPPENLRWARGYDLAISTRDSADFTASFRCALDKATGDLYIADGFRKRMEFPEQKRFIIERIRQERNTEHGLEQALHGMAFIQELRREHHLFGRAFRGVKVRGDKFTRALAWANLAEEGKVILVRGTTSTNPAFRQPNWIDTFLDEICTFPNSTHDDQLDAVSIAVEMLERHKNAFFAF